MALLGAELERSAELDTRAQLIPEPDNPYDANAVSVQVDDLLVGYLAKEIAGSYAPVLAAMCSSGLIPTVPVHLWARVYEDHQEQPDGSYTPVRRVYTRAAVALAEPDLIRPINLPPPRPRAEIPVGSSVKVTNTQANFAHLASLLAGRRRGWVSASLHRVGPLTSRSKRPAVEVRVNGATAGALTPQMSETYLPLIDRLDEVGCSTVVRMLLQGGPVSVVAYLHTLRPHELSAQWLTNVTAAR